MWRNVRDLGLLLQDLGVDVEIGLRPDATVLHAAAKAAGLRTGGFGALARSRSALWHVHLHDTYDRPAWAWIQARRVIGPTVISEHLPRNHASDSTLEPQDPRTLGADQAKTIFKRMEFAAADEVIAVGLSSARFINTRYGRTPQRVRVVQNGITTPDPDPQLPNTHGDVPLRVLGIGGLGRQKGFDVLVRAAAAAQRPWQLTIAGTGSQLPVLETLARDIPNHQIEFVGWVDDPSGLMRRSDVICMPSRWESFPYVALEALSRARPVVGTRVDGLDEIITEDTGLLVDPDRADQIAQALDRLSTDRPLLARLGKAGPQRAAEFSLARMLSGTLEVYASAWAARAPALMPLTDD